MWRASNIQVVWFPVNVDKATASNLFEVIAGFEPDGFERNRVPSPSSPFLSRAFGLRDGENHKVQIGPGRVDWFIEPHLKNNEMVYDHLLDLGESIEAIRKTVLEADEGLVGDVTRMSIVSSLALPVATEDEATQGWLRICGVPLNSAGLMDLSLQANRRVTVANGVEINRIARFSTERSSLFLLRVDQQTGQAVTSVPQRNERFAIRVVLDFNTVPSGKVFGVSGQKEFFSILMDQTLSAAENPTIEILRE